MIDWARVTDLRSEVEEEDFDEIVALFLEEVAEVTGRLAAGPPRAPAGGYAFPERQHHEPRL